MYKAGRALPLTKLENTLELPVYPYDCDHVTADSEDTDNWKALKDSGAGAALIFDEIKLTHVVAEGNVT